MQLNDRMYMQKSIYPLSKYKPIFFNKGTFGILHLSQDTCRKIGQTLDIVKKSTSIKDFWPLLFLYELENRYVSIKADVLSKP